MSEEFWILLILLIVDIAFGLADLYIRLHRGVKYIEKTEE